MRLLGFHDAGPRGVPLVNAMVDALQDRGLLGRGAAYWVGYVTRRGARDPMQVVDRIASLPRNPDPLPPDDARALGVVDGRRARVASESGSVEVPVEVSDEMMRGVVSLPHGFGHARAGTQLIYEELAAQRAGDGEP